MLLGSSGAWALGTTAGTRIDNNATLSYSAGGVLQPEVNASTNDHGSADSFVVDKKIDMILTTDETDQVSVTPGQEDRITEYTFTNEGNADQNFKFTVINLADDEEADYDDDKDNEDVREDSGHEMVIEYSTDNGSSWDELPTDGIVTVGHEAGTDDVIKLRVKADIPEAPTGADGDIMNIELRAVAYKDDKTAKEDETTGADTDTDTPDVVFADGESVANGSDADGLGKKESDDTGHKGDVAGDGEEAARSGYIIQTPVLSVSKTSCPLSDPVNNENNPKRIPGAIIRYMFDIDNTGTGDVTDVNLTDTLSSNLILTETVSSARKTENQGTTACDCATEPNDDISGDTSLSGNDMTIQHINVAAGHAIGTPEAHNHTCVSVEVEID